VLHDVLIENFQPLASGVTVQVAVPGRVAVEVCLVRDGAEVREPEKVGGADGVSGVGGRGKENDVLWADVFVDEVAVFVYSIVSGVYGA
jgi:hypothetical protein